MECLTVNVKRKTFSFLSPTKYYKNSDEESLTSLTFGETEPKDDHVHRSGQY